MVRESQSVDRETLKEVNQIHRPVRHRQRAPARSACQGACTHQYDWPSCHRTAGLCDGAGLNGGSVRASSMFEGSSGVQLLTPFLRFSPERGRRRASGGARRPGRIPRSQVQPVSLCWSVTLTTSSRTLSSSSANEKLFPETGSSRRLPQRPEAHRQHRLAHRR